VFEYLPKLPALSIRERQLSILAAPVVNDVFGDSALNPKRASNSRTNNRPPSEVTRDP